MSEQSTFSFDQAHSYDWHDFIQSPSNQDAYDWVMSYPENAESISMIIGPKGSGKTHLASIWKERMQAIALPASHFPKWFEVAHDGHPVVVEDIETVSQESIFHLLNRAKLEQFPVLLTTNQLPKTFELKDVVSRLAAIPTCMIEQPDSDLFAWLLTKQFSEKQLRVDEGVIQYLTQRVERSYARIHGLVNALDVYALAHKRSITIPCVKAFLEEENN